MRDDNRSYSRSEILRIVRRMRAEYGDACTFRRFRGQTAIAAESIKQLFGGWQRLLRAVGRDPHPERRRRRFTDQELVDRLRQLAGERGNWITQEQFAQHVGVTVSCLYRRFGSWRALREAAGMWRKATPRRLYTNRELLDDVLRIYLRTGRVPTYQMHKFYGGRFPSNTVRRRFGGSWAGVTRVFEVYLQEYFLSLDPGWTLTEHEQTFQPGIGNKLQWPADKAGREWSIEKGWR